MELARSARERRVAWARERLSDAGQGDVIDTADDVASLLYMVFELGRSAEGDCFSDATINSMADVCLRGSCMVLALHDELSRALDRIEALEAANGDGA